MGGDRISPNFPLAHRLQHNTVRDVRGSQFPRIEPAKIPKTRVPPVRKITCEKEKDPLRKGE